MSQKDQCPVNYDLKIDPDSNEYYIQINLIQKDKIQKDMSHKDQCRQRQRQRQQRVNTFL